MGIEDIEIPEVPIPTRILEEKRAAARRTKRALAKKQSSKKWRSTTSRSVKKAS
jgi:hypothetical protein